MAIDPPFRPEHRVMFGLQGKHHVEEPVPAIETTVFDTRIEIVTSDGGRLDFRGEHVHGRKRDRFLNLSWGRSEAIEPFVMFARAKIKLAGIPSELVDVTVSDGVDLVCELQATNEQAQPASVTIKPPAVSWHTSA